MIHGSCVIITPCSYKLLAALYYYSSNTAQTNVQKQIIDFTCLVYQSIEFLIIIVHGILSYTAFQKARMQASRWSIWLVWQCYIKQAQRLTQISR